MEVTLLDHRFLRAKPSMIAAIGMYLARRMLGGEWVSTRLARLSPRRPHTDTRPRAQNDAFIFYSNYTEAQLVTPTGFLVESIAAPDFEKKFVFKKYAAKSESRFPRSRHDVPHLTPPVRQSFSRLPTLRATGAPRTPPHPRPTTTARPQLKAAHPSSPTADRLRSPFTAHLNLYFRTVQHTTHFYPGPSNPHPLPSSSPFIILPHFALSPPDAEHLQRRLGSLYPLLPPPAVSSHVYCRLWNHRIASTLSVDEQQVDVPLLEDINHLHRLANVNCGLHQLGNDRRTEQCVLKTTSRPGTPPGSRAARTRGRAGRLRRGTGVERMGNGVVTGQRTPGEKGSGPRPASLT